MPSRTRCAPLDFTGYGDRGPLAGLKSTRLLHSGYLWRSRASTAQPGGIYNLRPPLTHLAHGSRMTDGEIFGQPDTTFAAGFFPPRRAVSVDGGYRVTGQTPFASGAHQARWFMGLAQIHDGDAPRLAADGTPVTLMTMCPAHEGDCRYMAHPGYARDRQPRHPDDRCIRAFAPRSVAGPAGKAWECVRRPIFKLSVWAAIAVLATVPLGIARAAIDDLLELAARKAPSYLATPLKDRINIQALVGEAEATLGAGRAYLYEALREVWDKALQGYVIDMPGKMKLQLAATYAAAAAAKVVDLVRKGCRDDGDSRRASLPATLSRRAHDHPACVHFGEPI